MGRPLMLEAAQLLARGQVEETDDAVIWPAPDGGHAHLGPITTGGGLVEAVRPFHKATTQRVAPLRSRPIAATAGRAMGKGTPNRNVGKRSGPR
jgi:hypothetical protein